MKDTKQHWEQVFAGKTAEEMSWYQAYPETSAGLFGQCRLPPGANLIDIGAGDSRLVDVFLEKGYKNIYALDIAATGLERAKTRLGDKAKQVQWIVSDIRNFEPPVAFDFWHDRAAFHFLTDETDITAYVLLAGKSIRPGGWLVLGTFSENGPAKCSGLAIRQYNAAILSRLFRHSFTRIRCFNEQHMTPTQTVQHFVYCIFRRR